MSEDQLFVNKQQTLFCSPDGVYMKKSVKLESVQYFGFLFKY